MNPDPNALNPNPNPNPSPSPNPKPGPDPKPEPEPHPTQGELPRHPEPFRADELKDMLETSMNKHDPISNNYNEVSTRARARARTRAHAQMHTHRCARTPACHARGARCSVARSCSGLACRRRAARAVHEHATRRLQAGCPPRARCTATPLTLGCHPAARRY